jgi:glycosyltransferase involved in cell wall biosynthesis
VPLSIVHVIGSSIIGGAECHLVDLVEGMRDNGIANVVICPRPGPLVHMLNCRGIRVEQIEMWRQDPDGTFAPDNEAISKISMILKMVRPDIVHSHLYPATLLACLASHEAQISHTVCTIPSLDIGPEMIWLTRERGLYSIAVAQAVAEAAQDAGIPSERIEVINNCASPEHFSSNSGLVKQLKSDLRLRAGYIFGTVSRLSHEKGVDVFLRALPEVRQALPQITALIVGEGPQLDELRQLAQDLSIDDLVQFIGARSDVAQINRLLDIFVLASRREACSLAILEAMAAGRAVIATSVGGTPEIITHKVNGWLIPPEDPSELAKAIVALSIDTDRRGNLGNAARQLISDKFNRQRMISLTEAFYYRILGAH